MMWYIKPTQNIINSIKQCYDRMRSYLRFSVYFGKHPANVRGDSIIFFPYCENTLSCGIAGIVSIKNKEENAATIDPAYFNNIISKIEACRYPDCREKDRNIDRINYLGGKELIDSFYQSVRALNRSDMFYGVFLDRNVRNSLRNIADRLNTIISLEAKLFSENMGHLSTGEVDTISGLINLLRDIEWCLSKEILANVDKIKSLLNLPSDKPASAGVSIETEFAGVRIIKSINAVLNSLDSLEVRGRDSAGISLMFIVDTLEYEKIKTSLDDADLLEKLEERSRKDVLVNKSISLREFEDSSGNKLISFALTYKIAAEIGHLGDNIRFLRNQIKNDLILQKLITFSHQYHTVTSHTRWASIGAITESNCHPVDNALIGRNQDNAGIIHVCLNGDIDNYLELKSDLEKNGNLIHKDITTDTKIIPLQIEKYAHLGFDMEESFRMAVSDFDGSHAIMMQTDMAPGKIFLAQKGSGQAIFIGLAEDHYLPTSEVYGFIEETSYYIKLDGEKTIEGKNSITQGQIFILSQNSGKGIDGGIRAMYYDGTPIELGQEDIQQTEITSRDTDRQEFAHYFLKEISESPLSVEKTLQNRWKIREGDRERYFVELDETIFPDALKTSLLTNRIRKIFFVGQGTAGVAALACSEILNHYLDEPLLQVGALKSSELSGFKLGLNEHSSMSDTLVVFISQSGTTTDTNRAADMVKERGAHTIAIVNRRDSDITFKVHGVMYTSNGRDIEMSVASTKAFYSQIVAGSLLSLHISFLKGCRNEEFVSEEIIQLLEIPSKMNEILSMHEEIKKSAKRLAVGKTYWATVGSGPNKASADEIRIKLSELCYKTISSDYVEDKKHIDLSSEPLIIVCAAGASGSVIGDIIKDTAIFQAHKATPVVIADKGEDRFSPYAADVFHVPVVQQHFAPIVNTLVGHIWGYYAALAINESSQFLDEFRRDIQNLIGSSAEKGLDVYEIILEKSFREKIAFFYYEFRKKNVQNLLPTVLGHKAVSDLTLLLKYLLGKLPISDFELDFDIKGTASNMLNKFFECVGESIEILVRPVDAIKHQAKTVTVGTSRISEKVEGILFDALTRNNFSISQLTVQNILVLRNLQRIISDVKGSIRYRIGNLNLLGEIADETTIEVENKTGTLKIIPSRVEADNRLMGTKRIIVREGNVYIGKGRKDDRSIIIIPIISGSHTTPNLIGQLLLLNVSFRKDVPLPAKIHALGGKYERIKNTVQENSTRWQDTHLQLFEMEELFGRSAEKLGDFIIAKVNGSNSSPS